MKKNTLFLVLGLVISLSSCNMEESILPDFRDDFLDFSYIDTTSYEFLRLETTHESLIQNISEVLFDTSYVFVFDDKSKAVFIFDSNGSYLSKIAAIGRGPGEYSQNVKTFDLDRKRNEIVMFDPSSRKILRYSYLGDFLREVTLIDYRGTHFAYLGHDKYVFSYNYEGYQLVLTDSVGNVLSHFHPNVTKNQELSLGMTMFFSKNTNNSPYYIPVWEDKIFQITHEGVKMVLDFNFSDRFVSSGSELSRYNQLQSVEKYSFFKDIRVAYPTGFYFETRYCNEMDGSGYLGQELIVTGTLEGAVLDAGKFQIADLTKLRNYLPAIGSPIGNLDGRFIVPISTIIIKSRYSDQFTDVDFNDNPFLLFFKLDEKKDLK